MAENLKVLGQLAPSATTETTLYTVPGATKTVISALYVANRSATSATYRIVVAVAGAATTNVMYLFYDVTLNGNDSQCICQGVTLNATDVIKVYASTANVSFNLFGSENT